MDLSLKICRDVWGGWNVHGLAPLPVEHLPSLSASIDYARKECAAAPATIEFRCPPGELDWYARWFGEMGEDAVVECPADLIARILARNEKIFAIYKKTSER